MKTFARLTSREKIVASCSNPYYQGFATKTEVKRAKNKARGKFWYDNNLEQYISFSPTGRREFFDVNFWGDNSKLAQQFFVEWKRIGKNVARYWSKGQYKKAMDLYRLAWDNRDDLIATRKI